MVLTKNELISALNGEVRLLLHLASKVDPAKLDYRPTAKQRSTLELLQYMTLVGPIHLRATLSPRFDMDAWKRAWTEGEAKATMLTLEKAKESIARQPALFAELLGPASDDDFRAEIELFGHKASRGSWTVSLVLNHYAAYRMQLFLYLKASGREELNTLNLWAGVDGAM
ncbi:MAG TPA: hypothetical protein VFB63_28915 [Bryobacteraceae bacterium]|jgi:hypothetical protein|nr:hypothetical protein [Bryobacteraceae bacterium]